MFDVEPEGEWRQEAACLHRTYLMFPKAHKDITYIPIARTICRGCPVQSECLNYALEFPPGDMHGVWAGMTPRQLAAEQRRRGLRPTRPTIAAMLAGMAGEDGRGRRRKVVEAS